LNSCAAVRERVDLSLVELVAGSTGLEHLAVVAELREGEPEEFL
jgi:hypothetical protein